MLIKLYRLKTTKTSILGFMTLGFARFYTLENAEKALKPGKYSVIVNKSQKFGRPLPLVFNGEVSKERGYRMHVGNFRKDSEGCILVGNTSDLARLCIGDSARAERQLVTTLNDGTEHTLYIEELGL